MTSNFSLSSTSFQQVSNTSISTNVSQIYFPFRPSSLRIPKFLNTIPCYVKTRHTCHGTRSISPGWRWKDGSRLCCVDEQEKKKERKKRGIFESVLHENSRQVSDKGSVMHACMRTTLLPKRRLRVHCATPASHSNNGASGCLHADITGCHWNLHGAERLSENRLFRSFMGGNDDRGEARSQC